jgi:hypothetical protein
MTQYMASLTHSSMTAPSRAYRVELLAAHIVIVEINAYKRRAESVTEHGAIAYKETARPPDSGGRRACTVLEWCSYSVSMGYVWC